MEQTLPMFAAAALQRGVEPNTTEQKHDVEDHEQLENNRKRTSIMTIVVFGLVLASFGFQGAAIGLNVDVLLVIISGAIACAVTGTTVVKQILMRNLDTLRVIHNKVRMDVNRFMEANNVLTQNVDDLEVEVNKLQNLEQQLRKIAEKQSMTAEDLVSLVKENKVTLEEQKKLAKAELQEQLLATVLRTDRDGDFQINKREANVLILRMKNHGGIDFDEESVRSALLETNGSLPALMKIIRDIGEGAEEEEEEDEKDGDQVTNMRNSTRNCNRLVKVDDKKFMESVKTNYSLSSFGDSSQSFLGHESANSLLESRTS